MNRSAFLLIAAALTFGVAVNTPRAFAESSANAEAAGSSAAQTLDTARMSLVTIQYTFDNELGKRDLSGTGFFVREDGLVAVPLGLIPFGLPDVQLTDFKVILPPGADGSETKDLDAEFVARDERSELAFVRVKPDPKSPRKFTPIKIESVSLTVGDPLVSVGLLPKSAGYTPFVRMGYVSAKLRGPTPMYMASGGLANVGGLVYNRSGKLVGIISETEGQSALSNAARNGRGRAQTSDDQAMEMVQLQLAPLFFTPIDDYAVSLNDLPNADHPRARGWIGVGEMKGLEEDVATFYGVKDQPAVQVSDVIPDFAAAKSGIKSGDVILKMNGQPLERGDQVEELPAILQRKLLRMNVGDRVTFSVVSKPGEAAHDVVVTLTERPMMANLAKRQFFDDLGFSVRDIVFDDTYSRKLNPGYKGVLVGLIRPQSSAQAGGLQIRDIITKLNQTPVENVEQFKAAYEKMRKDSPNEAVVMEVYRGTGTEIVRIQPPQ